MSSKEKDTVGFLQGTLDVVSAAQDSTAKGASGTASTTSSSKVPSVSHREFRAEDSTSSMSKQQVQRILELLEAPIEVAEFEEATGIVVELRSAWGFRQLLGPFSKNTPDALVAIERLRAEEDPADEPNTYTLHLLYEPPVVASAHLPKPTRLRPLD